MGCGGINTVKPLFYLFKTGNLSERHKSFYSIARNGNALSSIIFYIPIKLQFNLSNNSQ